MKLLDVNVLLAAHRVDHPQFAVARGFLDRLTVGAEPFGAPESVWVGVIRLATSRRIFTAPTSLAGAFAFYRAVRRQPGYVGIEPGARHADLFLDVCTTGECTGDLVADAYLASLALEYGCDLVSFDRDFARFPGLRWVRPE